MTSPEDLLIAEFRALVPDAHVVVEVPPDPKLGDLAIPCFSFAKVLKKAPNVIAQELASQLLPSGVFARFEASGPYINAFFDQQKISELVLGAPFSFSSKDKTLLFEYPSPNTNKPLHLGHLRNMLLGLSMVKICSAVGFKVLQTNIVNNRGIHICKSMLAYQLLGNGETPESAGMKSDHFVGKWYVKYNELLDEDPSIADQAQEMLRKWEAGDTEVRELWQRMNDWALAGHQVSYDRVGVVHDVQQYESDIYAHGKEIVLEGLKDGVFQRGDTGQIFVDLGKLGEKVLLRSDGTSVYMTQDLYLAKLRADMFHPDAQIYVVGDEQRMHFEQLFAVQKLLGFGGADGLYHLAYGMISLPEGRMKSREGTVVDLDDLLVQMQELAAQEVSKRHPDASDDEVQHRARVIGDAALRYFILRFEPKTGFVYNPKESLSFEGDTGPYILYAVARINSLFRDCAPPAVADLSQLSSEQAMHLVRLMRLSSSVVEVAAKSYKPHLVAKHAMLLAQAFTAFYHAQPVLKASDAVKDARLLLLAKVKEHITFLLGLLGIETLEQM